MADPLQALPGDWHERTPEEKAAWLYQQVLCAKRSEWIRLLALLLETDDPATGPKAGESP